ncbi:FAD-binding oxidoreductase [Maritimibacter sp. DP1N21-5]|uniref:FAD-binding oxidoreductase n=1 Tax=Maritimibacter sp. DP1N21-5 TaxID=2836867 RepID=UPI001C44873C|nr:FAD-binding oxidoreductase [Maritimibacter sp. DP1N21-5]MBV7408504.1 FAD-binding oxidoreductase [Maritimibacter sp. DP1N21-5]
MDFMEAARLVIGADHVLTGQDTARFAQDSAGKYLSTPLCVLRPGSTEEVSALLSLATRHGQPIVPVSGNTGVSGGTSTQGAAMLSLERMNHILALKPEARLAVIEAGVILDRLRDAAAEHGLTFPVVFGARGSAMLGGMLATNAGGSNVLRYGNTRAQVLGLEAVLADGRVMDLMSELHKDNSGYDLRDLLIGSEGTLGIITRAVVKLVPLPRHLTTAMVAPVTLPAALTLLNRLQEATGGMVEACEYMPRSYIERSLARAMPEPFDTPQDVNVLLELGGGAGIGEVFEQVLSDALEEGLIADAVIAQNEAQRAAMWHRREAAAEIMLAPGAKAMNDISLPLDAVPVFFARMSARLPELDAEATDISVAHLGDGNIHYVIYAGRADPDHLSALVTEVDRVVAELGGSFSAEHGIGVLKRPSMERHKDPVALDVMRAIKAALDPAGILNPGKVLPD